MPTEGVKATIQQGIQALDEAKRTLLAANGGLLDGTRLALATLHDTRNEDAEQARKELDEAAHEIELTLRRLEAAKTQASEYLKTIG